MRLCVGLLGLVVSTCGCAGPLGAAPLVLTEIPNRPFGQALVVLGAERSGCRVSQAGAGALELSCPEGRLEVPVFPGPPTFAVRCVDPRLQDKPTCSALVRKVLLASEGSGPPSS